MISVRAAQAHDSDRLLEWRNDPATVAASLNATTVDERDHTRWLSEVLADPARVLYIGEQGATDPVPVGMCRFDLDRERTSAEVSINLAPAQRGRRLSRPLLEAAIAQLSIDQPNVLALSATIRSDNTPSRMLFSSAGFLLKEEDKGVERYVRALG